LLNGFRFDVEATNEVETLFPLSVNCDEDLIRMSVTSQIDDPDEASDFVSMLRNNPESDVDIEINSRGGSVDKAMGMFNAMSEHPGTVTARITGIAASSGLLVAQGADRVIINENAQIMMHPASALALLNVKGLTDDAQGVMDFLREMADKGTHQIIDLLARRSGQPREDVENLVTAKGGMGTTLTGAEAVDMGFADEMVEMVQRGEKQEASTRNAAFNSWKEAELAAIEQIELELQS